MVLGYGTHREHDSGRRGSDPDARSRLRSRVGEAIPLPCGEAHRGSRDRNESLCVRARDPTRERRGRLERQLNSLYHADFGRRVNREPFRRAAGIGVLASRLELLEGLDSPEVADAGCPGTHARSAPVYLDRNRHCGPGGAVPGPGAGPLSLTPRPLNH